tara:strand:+ start:3993 stop:4841 length:849 start_codon:yes stop_codon:yes gene_type:complete
MFGEKIDTHIIRLISHSRNLKTEDQLESESLLSNRSTNEQKFNRFIERAGEKFKWKESRILDVCCGEGDLARSLAKNGAKEVCGVDLQSKHISMAKSIADKEEILNVKFVESDFHKFETNEKFDYVISNEIFDHIPDLEKTLMKMVSMLKNNGKIVIFTGAFWGSPSADHCSGFMRFFIPWRHLIFNEKALLKVRREKFRPTDNGNSFSEIRGGLSKYWFSHYYKSIKNLGLNIEADECNYQFKYLYNGRLKFLFSLSKIISLIPIIGEFFIYSSFIILSKK